MSRSQCDLLVCGASQIATLDDGSPRLPSPERIQALEVVRNGAVAVKDGMVLRVGPEKEIRQAYRAAKELDAGGGVVVPGFIDAHTHPVFTCGRAEEFEWRSQGQTYLEIAQKGGGILASVRGVREAPLTRLTDIVAAHFLRMQRHGTVACEAKSGYGLNTAEEMKSLKAIRAAAEKTGMEVFPTFLGAHMVPEEYRGNPDRYVDLLCEESLPAVAESGLARAADAYVEPHAFDYKRSERYLTRAVDLGFALRVHADQFENCGGTTLAAELGAECVDHLEALDDAGLEALKKSGAFAGLLPAVPHFLRQKADAPARRLIKAGIPFFVATDFNPGTCFTPSIPEAIHFARIRLRLTLAEALAGTTLFAAASLGVANRKGRIASGYDADLVILDLPDLNSLGYGFGENPVKHLISRGRQLF